MLRHTQASVATCYDMRVYSFRIWLRPNNLLISEHVNDEASKYHRSYHLLRHAFGIVNVDGLQPCNQDKKTKRVGQQLTLEDIKPYFQLNIEDAAKALGVGLTMFKRKCRKVGIPRWPKRKVRCLHLSVVNLNKSKSVVNWTKNQQMFDFSVTSFGISVYRLRSQERKPSSSCQTLSFNMNIIEYLK